MGTHLPAIDALGTRFRIEVFDDIPQNRLEAAHSSVKAILSQFENQYSRFRPDSYVSQLNTTGHLQSPAVEFLTLLRYGLDAYDRTDGVFNIMIGAKLVAQGYDQTYSFIATPHTNVIPNPHDMLVLTTDHITLSHGQLDLGGLGKGYVIDMIAKYLKHEFGFKYFLVNGGGDMYGTSDHDTPITLYLEHPLDTGTYLATTTIENRGFAASSPHKRTWTSGTKTYTHIIDTVKSIPETNQLDATFITAATAVDADMFATVGLIMSPESFAVIAARESLGMATYTHRGGFLEANSRFPVDVS